MLEVGFEALFEDSGDGLDLRCGKIFFRGGGGGWEGFFFYLSSLVSRRPMLSFRTSGRYQTCSFRRKNSLPASRMILGKVTKPTHHQEMMNLSFPQRSSVSGSIASWVENTRAMILA